MSDRASSACATCGECCKFCVINGGFFTDEEHPIATTFTRARLLWDMHGYPAGRAAELMALKRELDASVGMEFNLKTGYLGERGCILPREKRSAYCKEYMCELAILHETKPDEAGGG